MRNAGPGVELQRNTAQPTRKDRARYAVPPTPAGLARMDPPALATLQAMPIFGAIRTEVLQLLVQHSATVDVPKGAFFFRENDTAESLFVLESGRVAILKRWNGEDHLLAYMGPGDCFGEMALMDLSPRSASALAMEASTALELRAASLLEVYEKDLEQFALIQMNLGREVSRRLRLADERLFRVRVGACGAGLPNDTIHST
jgi:CRP/FNR family transcriptional regulator, cyclic AMP receptor protein